MQVPLGATNLEYDAKGTVTLAEPTGEGDSEPQGGRGLLSGESLICKQIKQEAFTRAGPLGLDSRPYLRVDRWAGPRMRGRRDGRLAGLIELHSVLLSRRTSAK